MHGNDYLNEVIRSGNITQDRDKTQLLAVFFFFFRRKTRVFCPFIHLDELITVGMQNLGFQNLVFY